MRVWVTAGVVLSVCGSAPAAAQWDLTRFEELQEAADQLARHALRVEVPPRPVAGVSVFGASEDGVALLVAPGVAVTPAAYLREREAVYVVRRDGRRAQARVRVLEKHRGLDARGTPPAVRDRAGDDETPQEAHGAEMTYDAGLALLELPPEFAPYLEPVRGWAEAPRPAAEARPDALAAVRPTPHPRHGGARVRGSAGDALGTAEVVIPTTLTGDIRAVRVTATAWESGVLYLAGPLANGVPAFDRSGRLVAMALAPTPGRERSVALSGTEIERWVQQALAGGSP